MPTVSSSLYFPSFRKVVCALLFLTVSLFVASDEKILVNALTADVEVLKSRVVNVTLGLNSDALLVEDANVTSYQSKAFLQLSQQVNVDEFTDAKIAQYYSLYCIFFATNAVANEITDSDSRFENITLPEWTEQKNWKNFTVDPCGSTVISPDEVTSNASIATTLSATTIAGWDGVSCDAEGRVVFLELFENFLTGIWPEEVVLLASDGPFSTGAGGLALLDLYGNKFLSNGGDSSWISELGSNMTTIILEDTGFKGDIPLLPENLTGFNAANAFFTGGLNDDTFELSRQLMYLNLDGNLFNTSIPPILSQLPDLQFLHMSDNFLVGDLSPLEGSLALKEFWADGNTGLTGPLYSWLGNITSLASLSLAYNKLTGTLPVELGYLTGMQQLWLQFNNLTGTVPIELGNMLHLKHLELEANSFTGFVHASICQKTEFPYQTLKTVGADCLDANFFCPCCTCCSLQECVEGGQEEVGGRPRT